MGPFGLGWVYLFLGGRYKKIGPVCLLFILLRLDVKGM